MNRLLDHSGRALGLLIVMALLLGCQIQKSEPYPTGASVQDMIRAHGEPMENVERSMEGWSDEINLQKRDINRFALAFEKGSGKQVARCIIWHWDQSLAGGTPADIVYTFFDSSGNLLGHACLNIYVSEESVLRELQAVPPASASGHSTLLK